MQGRRIAVVLALLVTAAHAADPAPIASGTFTSHDITLRVKSAMAFRGESALDKSAVTVVAVTNAKIDTAALADYYDRRRAFERRIKDGDTGVVYLEFHPDGRYRAVSYYFAPGNGCAYCSGGVTSTVKLANGRLAGSLKGADGNRTFDLTLDVPVVPDDHGTAVPGDGGPAAKAYLDYRAALARNDVKAVRPLLAEESRGLLDKAVKEGKGAGFLAYLAEGHPGKSVQITKALVKGDKAVLLITGTSGDARVTGEVLLANEGGGWRVVDELTDEVR